MIDEKHREGESRVYYKYIYTYNEKIMIVVFLRLQVELHGISGNCEILRVKSKVVINLPIL